MRPHAYFVGLSLAALLVGNPAQWLTDDNSVNSGDDPTNSVVEGAGPVTDEFAQPEREIEEIFALREQEYCYIGSETDPATGEIVDLYVLCGNDEVTDSLTPT
jgi:hypothetical protein